ncbi:DM13 domain-containing protein [Micromonospora sp. NPDC000089]|uniref:DM13 domain-containing protein n=1 Tax=unclassified Micromonospora TaxID=2617518 RepID=UPI0036924EF0
MISRLLRAPLTWLVIAVLGVGVALGLYWFQPWKLVTDNRVDEELSAVAAPTTTPAAPVGTAGPTAAPGPTVTGPSLVRRGEFVSHEHDTAGTARIVRGADGGYRLELVGLATSNGPDLRVWLTDQPVRAGRASWDVFDDGRWVEVGRLKGNRGDQAYPIPAGVDLAGLTSVAIWCKRFGVSFGAAPLTPAS